MSLILGIDPGKHGGLAILDTDGNRVTTRDMPGTTRELHDFIAGLPIIKIAVVEKPYYPQMNGTANAGKKGEAYGVLIGALQWRDIPFREVRPVDWKQSLNVPTDKNAARQRAGQFFPDDADQWPLVKHDGRAEAAMIAWYGLRWAKGLAANAV
jgi:Holliday junction resolvasome RuvABC endonuclease subunit